MSAAGELIAIVRVLGNPRVLYIFLVDVPKVKDGFAVRKFFRIVVVGSGDSIPKEIGNPKVSMLIVEVME